MNTEKFEDHREGWRTLMARYRRSDGHYTYVECAYAEFERYLVLSCNEDAAAGKKKATKLVA
jgi:hypothetical protein